MGERVVRNDEVRGSIPLGSTRFPDCTVRTRRPGRWAFPNSSFAVVPGLDASRLRAWLGALVLVIVVVAGGLYFTQIQPGGLRPPAPALLASLEEEAEHPVFAYGTLTSGFVRFVVTFGLQDAEPATLAGYRREGRNILPAEGAMVDGVLFEVSPRELRRLDLYERLGERYERIEVELADGTTAWAYRRL